jgi:hypothetical protein
LVSSAALTTAAETCFGTDKPHLGSPAISTVVPAELATLPSTAQEVVSRATANCNDPGEHRFPQRLAIVRCPCFALRSGMSPARPTPPYEAHGCSKWCQAALDSWLGARRTAFWRLANRPLKQQCTSAPDRSPSFPDKDQVVMLAFHHASKENHTSPATCLACSVSCVPAQPIGPHPVYDESPDFPPDEYDCLLGQRS